MIKLIAIEPKDSYRLLLRFSDPASKIAARPRTVALCAWDRSLVSSRESALRIGLDSGRCQWYVSNAN